MYLGVLILPFLSSFFLGFFGFFLGVKGAIIVSLLFIGLSALLSILSFYEIVLCGTKVSFKLFSWFSVGSLDISWGFLFDSLTSVMLVVVVCISFLVHLYSVNYMGGDPHFVRFLSYLSLFTFFMLCFVTSDNFIQLFLGWEGVGVSSYLLINFWFTRIQANKAALKAIIINRFGDFTLLIGILILFYCFRTLTFGSIFAIAPYLNHFYIIIFDYKVHAMSLATFFLFLGAVGKSAQLGLHTWLPDAMEGPTPVSALIHAATMVTAGVFLLIRISPLLELAPGVLSIISIFGGLTAFFAATVGIFQNDLKRVIAYSTCSQLGYMVFACGLSNYSVSLFHLMNHAFFKALLFLSAGSVIHALLDEQDMRRMGGLVKILPFTFSVFVIGSLALMGFPYTTGYYSKDVILEIAFSNYYFEGIFCYWLGTAGACCTAFYSMRLLFLTFLSETNFYRSKFKFIHDTPFVLGLPLFILGLGSIFVGYLFKDVMIGVGSRSFGNSFGYFNNNFDVYLLEAEFLSVFFKLLPVVLSLFFSVISLFLYSYMSNFFYLVGKGKEKSYAKLIFLFFNKKWFFDYIYNNYIVVKVLSFGKAGSFQLIDRGILELIGPTGLVRLFSLFSKNISKLQTGFLYNYIYFMVISIFILFTFILDLMTINGILCLLVFFGIFLQLLNRD